MRARDSMGQAVVQWTFNKQRAPAIGKGHCENSTGLKPKRSQMKGIPVRSTPTEESMIKASAPRFGLHPRRNLGITMNIQELELLPRFHAVAGRAGSPPGSTRLYCATHSRSRSSSALFICISLEKHLCTSHMPA